MLDMLKARKEQLEAQGKKGFTLMEMLIVIAIIAVLIAIAIPVFTTQMAEANKAVDEANIRSGYAYVQSQVAMNKPDGDTAKTYLLLSNGEAAVIGESAPTNPSAYEAKGKGTNEDIAGLSVSWGDTQESGTNVNKYIVYKVEKVEGAWKVTAMKGVANNSGAVSW